MKLSCPSCGAKYSIADEKVQDRLAKIRCRKCSATIIVDGKVTPPNVYTADGASAPTHDAGEAPSSTAGVGAGEYSVDFGDNDQRTMSLDDIVQAYQRGELTADMYVWAEGMDDWTPIASVPDLAEALSASAPAAAPRAAARTGSGRGSAHDLFGGIDKAGSEEDVMTSAQQPAAGQQAGAVTGARNESSVLFSLSALTASAPAATAPLGRSAAQATADVAKPHDSGLIDLKALTSNVGTGVPAGPLGLSAPPLGMAAPLGGMTAPAVAADGPPLRGGGSKTGLYIGGAIVLVGALIAGAIVMSSANKDAANAASSAVATPVAVAPTPAPTPQPVEPTAQPPATGTNAAEPAPSAKTASVAAKAGAAGHATTGHAKSGGSSSGSAAASDKGSSGSSDKGSSPNADFGASSSSGSSGSGSDSSGGEKKKKKKEKTCNCGPGDLMCAMQCAAG